MKSPRPSPSTSPALPTTVPMCAFGSAPATLKRMPDAGSSCAHVGDGEDIVERRSHDDICAAVAVQVAGEGQGAAESVGGAPGGHKKEVVVGAGEELDETGARTTFHVGTRVSREEVRPSIPVE